MKVLIVDDSKAKADSLRHLVELHWQEPHVTISRAFQSALNSIENELFDLILLDMTIPTTERLDGRFEGRMRIFGGREILGEIELLDLDTQVIVVTQFDSFGEGDNLINLDGLTSELRRDFGENFIGAVYYSSFSDQWVEDLNEMFESKL